MGLGVDPCGTRRLRALPLMRPLEPSVGPSLTPEVLPVRHRAAVWALLAALRNGGGCLPPAASALGHQGQSGFARPDGDCQPVEVGQLAHRVTHPPSAVAVVAGQRSHPLGDGLCLCNDSKHETTLRTLNNRRYKLGQSQMLPAGRRSTTDQMSPIDFSGITPPKRSRERANAASRFGVPRPSLRRPLTPS